MKKRMVNKLTFVLLVVLVIAVLVAVGLKYKRDKDKKAEAVLKARRLRAALGSRARAMGY